MIADILNTKVKAALLAVVFLLPAALPARAEAPAAAHVLRGGPHDFDFEFGDWKCHLKRRLHPLTGSTEWVEYDGTSNVRKVWNGKANLGELELDGPAGHLEGLSLRLYNPAGQQWNVSFANAAAGRLGTAMIGGFKDGRGEFIDQESYGDRAIFVRFIFSDITERSFKLVQAFSDDAGKTWEDNWIAT
ncbi:MAG TPA: hypothetical protein VFH92_04880, partial [Phenylobacterium sp.]|nr:hypothetical protein [Phenylobacterium sp.]